MGVVVRRYTVYIDLIFFAAASLFFVHLKKKFSFLFQYFL